MVLTSEAIGLILGLLSLLMIGAWWCWACDVVDAYPEAFGLADEMTPNTRRAEINRAGRVDQRS